MSDLSNYEPPKITYISPIITERKQKRCKCKNRKFIIDTTNRTVECSICGHFIDPFDALLEITSRNERYDLYLQGRYTYALELDKWFKKHKEPIALKNLIEQYRKGLLPRCPHCKKIVDFEELTSWVNKQFYERINNDN